MGNIKLEFVDAQYMAVKHPNTFEAPKQADLDRIKIGSSVKVCVGRERFWVRVTSVIGNIINGVVDNDLVCTREHGLDLGSKVSFEKRHVYSIF